jgi:hypothetical protein
MNFFKRLFAPQPEPRTEVHHPGLGLLRYDGETKAWGKGVVTADHDVRLSVTGEETPHPELLERLIQVQSELPGLLLRIQSFLEGAAAEMPALANEIHSLRVEEIGFWWLRQPDSAMVFFKGLSEDRVWHCVYRAGELSGLAFDD